VGQRAALPALSRPVVAGEQRRMFIRSGPDRMFDELRSFQPVRMNAGCDLSQRHR